MNRLQRTKRQMMFLHLKLDTLLQFKAIDQRSLILKRKSLLGKHIKRVRWSLRRLERLRSTYLRGIIYLRYKAKKDFRKNKMLYECKDCFYFNYVNLIHLLHGDYATKEFRRFSHLPLL